MPTCVSTLGQTAGKMGKGEVDKILYILTGTWYNYPACVKVWCGAMDCTGRMADEILEI